VLDYVASGDVQHPVVVRPELYPDLRSCHLVWAYRFAT
jgi:hypothetical protein